MKARLIDAIIWLAIFCCAGVLSAFLSYPAWAQEAGTGIICDEQRQVEKFSALVTEDMQSNVSALTEVNGGTNACAIVNVVYVRGPTVSQVSNPQGLFEVVEITVIGADLGIGYRPVPPFKQFTLFKIAGQAI